MRRLKLASGLAVLAAGLMVHEAKASWVRGKAQIGGSGLTTIDPLYNAPDGDLFPTVSTGQFNDGQKGVFSQADMGNGALRGRAFVNGGSGNTAANPVLGETVTFYNGEAEPVVVDFSYAVDGRIWTTGSGVPVQTTYPGVGTYRTTFAQFAVHIFDGHSVGPIGTAESWQGQISNALFSQVKDIAGVPLTGTLIGNGELLEDSISGTLTLQPGYNFFDIVLVLAVVANVQPGVNATIDMDFSNTAALTIDSPVGYSSQTGVFLTGVNYVPEPMAGAVGLLAAPLLMRRRK